MAEEQTCPTCGNPDYQPKAHVPAFAPGDRVGHSHVVSTQHGRGSVMRTSAFLSAHGLSVAVSRQKKRAKAASADLEDAPIDGRLGTVTERGEIDRNQWEVLLDGDKEPRVLTADELVKLDEE